MSYHIHPTAEVEDGVSIGEGTRLWHFSHVRRGARLGSNCTLGRNAFVDLDVTIGNNCKFQNNATAYRGSRIGNGVFLGPYALLLNDKFPRAVTPDGRLKTDSDWTVSGVTLKDGCAIGGRAVVLPGVIVGEWALVGVGAVVTRDVPDQALVYGNPARIYGFVDRSGQRMKVANISASMVEYEGLDGSHFSVPTGIVPEHLLMP